MVRRLRPTRIEHVVDGHRLRAQLSAAALDALGDETEQRRRALEVLRAALFRGRMIAKERLEAGAGGIETAQLLSHVVDEVISALYDFTTVHMFRARNPTEGERLALLAVGGYGRGALAPFSDVDLLFLRPYKQTPHAESVIEYMLYALWDLGFKVGHASRTVEECVRLAREDYTIRTALLEARHLTGDEALSADLRRRFRKDVAEGTGAEFVAAKQKERDERHARAGASRYMVEPNVKEGKGGLRDLNTLFWIAQYLHPSDRPAEFVRLEEFTTRELKAFIRAFDFLWSVRAHLHYATGRAEERLSFDLQPEIARRMGYLDRANREGEQEPLETGVERFMRRYFLIAREVGSLTRVFCAKLETDQAKRSPQGLSRFLPQRFRGGRKGVAPGFLEESGRLTVESPSVFADNPINMLALFQLADRTNQDLHPDAFSAVSRALNLITPRLRRDPAAARVFLDILARGRQPYRTLELMNEAGVLGRYIPEFGRVVAQMQFNMYHSYTVDEHTLRAIGVMADIMAGRLAEDHPLAVSIAPMVEDREVLFLAMLLHDTGKGGEGGQELAGARAARSACERLGLSTSRIDAVAWLVEHHLVMSDFAQKRDVADPRTVTDFVRIVQDPERLRSLLILTVCDIRAVGPGVWNGWKGQLLRDLYAASEAVFRGGRSDDAADLARRAQADAARAALATRPDGATPDLGLWARQMEDAYFTAFSAEEQLRHYALVRRAADQGGAAASSEIRRDSPVAEVCVAAQDRRGLFADLAGVMSRMGANVVGARVYTSSAGQALDVFLVQDMAGGAFGCDHPQGTQRLLEALEEAGRGETPRAEAVRRSDAGRAAAFAVSSTVSVDNNASEGATVVEVSGRDRPGLLEALARTFALAELTIQSAHIECYGERAVDAFYVATLAGGKLEDARRISQLREALLAVLQAGDGDGSPARLRRQRARASLAR
jgi:[protein-PII] uridylyltransferase